MNKSEPDEIDISDSPILTKPEEIMANNQQLRQAAVNAMFNDGLKDPKVMRVVLAAMKDADDQVLKLKRLDQDDKNSANDREVAIRIAAQGLNLAKITGNPFERVVGNNKESEQASQEELLPKITVLPGQMDIGASEENYDDFMQKFDEDGNLIETP